MLNRWNFLKPGFYEGINIRGFSILSLLTTDRTSSRVLELALETLKLLLFLAVVGAALFLATRAGEAQSSGISISGTNNSELTISVSDPSSDFGDSLHPSGIDSTSSDTVADYQGNQGNQGTAVTEAGPTDTYDIVLDVVPDSTVTTTVTPDAQISLSSGTLTYTTGNWSTPQTVTVTAVNDAVVEGSHSGTVTHSASGGGYDGVSIPNVVATIADNDTASVTVTETSGSTDVEEGGPTDTYDVVLDLEPSGTVTITVSPDSDVSLSPNPPKDGLGDSP